MMWAASAITSAAFHGSKVVYNKRLLGRYDVNPFLLVLMAALVPAVVFAIYATFAGQWGAWQSSTFALAVFGNVVCVAIAELTFIYSLTHHDASAVESVRSLVPIVVAIGAFLLLGESIGLFAGIGIAVAVVGCFLLQASRQDYHLPGLKTSLWLVMSLNILVTGGATVFSRMALLNGDIAVYIASRYGLIAVVMTAFYFISAQRYGIKNNCRLHLLAVVGVIAVFSDFFEFVALSQAPAAYVEAIRKSGLVFVLAYEALFFHRHFNKKRWLAGGVLLLGVILVTLSNQLERLF